MPRRLTNKETVEFAGYLLTGRIKRANLGERSKRRWMVKGNRRGIGIYGGTKLQTLLLARRIEENPWFM